MGLNDFKLSRYFGETYMSSIGVLSADMMMMMKRTNGTGFQNRINDDVILFVHHNT